MSVRLDVFETKDLSADTISSGQFSTKDILARLLQERLAHMSEAQYSEIRYLLQLSFSNILGLIDERPPHHLSQEALAAQLIAVLRRYDNGIEQLAIILFRSEENLATLARK